MALLILSLSWLTQAGAHGVRLRGSWRGDDAAVARRGDETAAAFARDDAAARDGGPAIVDADATARRLSPSYDDDILAELSSNPLLMMFAILLLFGGGSCQTLARSIHLGRSSMTQTRDRAPVSSRTDGPPRTIRGPLPGRKAVERTREREAVERTRERDSRVV